MDSKKDLQSCHSISLKPSISDNHDALLCFINNFMRMYLHYNMVFKKKQEIKYIKAGICSHMQGWGL